MRRLPTPLVLLPVIGLLLISGCARDEPVEVAGSSVAETRLRRGLVSISQDEPPAYALDWRVPVAEIDEAGMAAARSRADAALADRQLFEDADAAIPIYLAILREQPLDEAAMDGLTKATAALFAMGDEVLDGDASEGVDIARAHAIAAVARTIAPEDARTLDYLTRVDAADRLQALLLHGEEQLAAGNLGESGVGAATAFREVLRNRPRDARAARGLAAVERRMLARASDAAREDDFEQADQWLAHAIRLGGTETEAVAQAHRRIVLRREARTARIYADILRRLEAPGEFGALRDAAADIKRLEEIAPRGDARVAAARQRLELATRYGVHRPGQRFSEALEGGGEGPEMVVVPHGSFLMGAPEDERDSSKAEWPQHRITFARGFAMARTEATVAEFGRFIAATGHRTRAERRGYSVVYAERSGNFVLRNDVTWRHDYAGRKAAGNLPVLHVDVRDAEAYAEWLSAQTGQRYRLPHEAEFEYALRAGGQGRFPWGDGEPPRGVGNLTGSLDRSPSGRRWGNAFQGYGDGYWGPAPVGTGRANAFGLHGLAGNVGEWVMDCWHQGYRRAPADGGAWFNPGCRSRVVRGGTWSSSPSQARSAWRMAQSHDITNARTGFRVVRDL